MATANFWTYCGQSLLGFCLFMEVSLRISQKRCSENFIEYFTHNKNGMAKLWAPKIFFHISKFLDILRKKIVVNSKPFIKIIGVFYC